MSTRQQSRVTLSERKTKGGTNVLDIQGHPCLQSAFGPRV